MDSLGATQHPSAVVFPTSRDSERPGRLFMGVFDRHGAYIDGSALDRRSGERGAPAAVSDYPNTDDADTEEAIYAGPLYFHFGHFLLESLARAWYAAEHPDIPIVWAGANTWHGKDFTQWQREILDILGIKNPIALVSRPTRFRKLHLPDIGYRYDDRFHPDHARFLARYEGPPQEPSHRLWLSRSLWAKDARDLNIDVTERRLRDEGWTILHPQRLSVRQQLDEISRASVIAGEEGSAFHSVILLAGVKNKKLRIFRRQGPEHRNLRTIAARRVIDQEFFTVKHEVILQSRGRYVVKTSGSASEILDALKVPVRPTLVRPSVVQPQLDILEALRAGLRAKRYLDTGEVGDAFHLTPIQDKVAVDEFFTFDPRQFEKAGAAYYELPFERYVDAGLWHAREDGQLDPSLKQFDIIRLSGRREEIFARFAIGQKLAGPTTVWFIDLGCEESRLRRAVMQVGEDFQIVPLNHHPGYLVHKSPSTTPAVTHEWPDRRIARHVGAVLLHRRLAAREGADRQTVRALFHPPSGRPLMPLRRSVGSRMDALLGTERTNRLRSAERALRNAAAERIAKPAPPEPTAPSAIQPEPVRAAKPSPSSHAAGVVGERAMAARGYIPSDAFTPHPRPTMTRYEFLAGLHAKLQPRTYLEVGVNKGRSLSLSRCRTIGVDPAFQIETELHCDLDLIKKSSDDFFNQQNPTAHLNGLPVDLGFIDGMHLSDYALRDFINLEPFTTPTSIVVFDDVLPRNPLEAARSRLTGAWAGDVYKVPEVIAGRHEGALVIFVNTEPTGTAVVLGLDPASTALAEAYDEELPYLQRHDPQSPPDSYMNRSVAVDPVVLLDSPGWRILVDARDDGDEHLVANALEELASVPRLGRDNRPQPSPHLI